MPKALTIPEAAEQLRVLPQTIRLWIKQGRLKAAKIGRNWIVTQDYIDKIITGEIVIPPMEIPKESKKGKRRK